MLAGAILTLVSLLPIPARGQPAATIEEGDRVRLTLASEPARELVGEVMDIDATSITVWLDFAYHLSRELEVPRSDLIRLERGTQVELEGHGGPERVIAAPLIVVGVTAASAILGAAVGGGIELAFNGDSCRGEGFICIPTGMLLGFAAGAATGVVVSIKLLSLPDTEERWMPARLPGDELGMPARDRAPLWGTAVTVRF